MTTDTQLRDLLSEAAGGPASPDWDGVVRRGRHHRRVARARLAGLAAVATIGLGAVLLAEPEARTVVVDEPDVAPPSSEAPPTSVPDDTVDPVAARQLEMARVGDRIVTVTFAPEDPVTGPDTCTALGPSLVESEDEVVIGVGPAQEQTHEWVACHSSPFSAWATIALREPLGGRDLIDRQSGGRLATVLDEELLFPTLVPEPFEAAHDEFGGGIVDGTEGSWTFSWSTGDLVLAVSRRTGAFERPLCPDLVDVTVRGVNGEVCSDRSAVVLSWYEGRSRFEVSYADVGDGDIGAAPPLDVVAIADGLEPLG